MLSKTAVNDFAKEVNPSLAKRLLNFNDIEYKRWFIIADVALL